MKNMSSLVRSNPIRVAVIIVLVAVAALGVYRYVGSGRAEAASGPSSPVSLAPAGTTAATPGASRGGCCGAGGRSSTPLEGAAQAAGGIQKISVDVSSGSYNPNVIKLKAGVPAEITFGQSSGCTGYVQSGDLGFQADLTGGPQTVKLPALQPGTYGFACGMGMVTGQIVVE